MFVGSPVGSEEKEVLQVLCALHIQSVFFLQLVRLAKRLKKEKVSVDIINFGEEVK